ncbi:hypothetical protein CC79DRAFT_1362938 [Sarocladium strictum]
MATRIESPRIATHLPDAPADSMGARVVPITTPTISMSAPSPGDPMEGTSPTSDANTDRTQRDTANGRSEDQCKDEGQGEQSSSNSNSMPAPPAAATGSVQTKVVQTAFIHKLYSMLEDSSISKLIAWADNGESFVMSPTADFSKVLSQYFKHTNISSFVRQLNMYGFHKERDVFHTGHPESTLWEFKHGNGNFKRGDLMGLREIKRRASRHALVHRESNYTKTSSSHPGTPAEAMPIPPETSDSRMAGIEHTLFDLTNRLQRSEEAAQYMHVRNQVITDTMGRLLQFNQDLSRTVLSLFPADSHHYRDIMNLQGEVQKQVDAVRALDEHHDAPYGGRQQYFGGMENPPVSPRQLAQDDPRRSALGVPQARSHNQYRPPVPSALSTGARRPFGSIGGGSGPPTAATHSSPLRNAAHPPAPERHPLSNVELPGSLARRHTSADIREHGWGAAPGHFPPGNAPPSQWPPSPNRGGPEDQRLRESLSTYSLQPAAALHHTSSRPTTPPGPPFAQPGSNGSGGGDTFGNWSWGSATRDKLGVKDSSAPPTRRGSMAHILNPSDTAERSDEDDDLRGDDDRKRKRMQ